ncbi:MAG TPA: DNA-formamidopyrimidine glycosylase family protein [Candidatus Dormibacteraeota bacterium]|jgi:formamidopyrimidine-DNA glycosylase|nr:DNA-formamidopyrimidine glycosylase family protein [Candidatus Dormibacteraeota bacterium]
MPELPELEALRISLGPRLEGRLVTAAEVTPRRAHLLRYPPESFTHELPYRRFARTWRRGKHLLFDLELAGGGDLRHLVINPMLGGRLDLAEADRPPPTSLVFSLRLAGGQELRFLDTATMSRIYWTPDPARDVPAWTSLGPEADRLPELGLEGFRRRLRRYRDELKDLLRNQSFLAGLGNAYSDEILWEARLLPLRRRPGLSAGEEEALFRAIQVVLERSLRAILANPDYRESKQDRGFMNVHGKGGRPCPRCGHRISQLGSGRGPGREPFNFCRGCQR